MKIISVSDVHHCRVNWYGLPSAKRIEKLITELNLYANDCEAILFLGDSSMDFWQYDICGSYINEGKSYTKELINNYFPKLSCKNISIIPGNHEQFDNDTWRNIAGTDRQFYKTIGGWLFVFLDVFSGNLNPKEHTDGTFTGVDTAYLNSVLQKYPHTPTILCAHWFDKQRESDAFKSILSNNPQIKLMLCGHDHIDIVDEFMGIPFIHDGNFSFATNDNQLNDITWGFRVIEINNNTVKSFYHSVECELNVNGQTINVPASDKRHVTINI